MTTTTKHYVIMRPCEYCAERHALYAAAGWTPWSSEKAARRHLQDLEGFGYNIEGWEVVEAP